jgi:hypothetical protein
MHQGIAGSKMIGFVGGHIFFILQAKDSLDTVLSFLGSVDR